MASRGINKAEVNLKESMTDEQKNIFWSKIDINEINGCWNWMGAKKSKGYGNVKINKKYYLSHRVSWELSNFKIPEKYLICHVCDNPSCCNPNHLMVGTPLSNVIDMVKKGRQQFRKNKATGMRNVNAKLTWDQVNKIRELYLSKSKNQYELASMFNVSQSSIGSIVNFKTRKTE